MTTTSARRLPLTVIGGFLGAGKTTLLQHWLRTAGGRRLAVLVNDFGALNVDAALITASGADTIALSNGCVCCQIGDDLSAALMRVLDDAQRFDAIVVEASGVSDPWRIAQIGLADPALALGGVIVLADASALPAQAADPLLADTLQRQLDSADLIVLNKTDLVDAAGLQRVGDWLDAHAGQVPRLQTRQAAVPPLLLDELRLPRAATPADGCAPEAHGHAHDHAGAGGPDSGHGQAHDAGDPCPRRVVRHLVGAARRRLFRGRPARSAARAAARRAASERLAAHRRARLERAAVRGPSRRAAACAGRARRGCGAGRHRPARPALGAGAGRLAGRSPRRRPGASEAVRQPAGARRGSARATSAVMPPRRGTMGAPCRSRS
jgi:G3E family GTPase